MPLLLFLSSVTGHCFFLWHHTHHHHHRQQSQQQLLVSIRWSVAHYWWRWYASIFTLATANLNSCLWRLAITHTHIHTLLAPSPSPRLATKSSAQSATLSAPQSVCCWRRRRKKEGKEDISQHLDFTRVLAFQCAVFPSSSFSCARLTHPRQSSLSTSTLTSYFSWGKPRYCFSATFFFQKWSRHIFTSYYLWSR